MVAAIRAATVLVLITDILIAAVHESAFGTGDGERSDGE